MPGHSTSVCVLGWTSFDFFSQGEEEFEQNVQSFFSKLIYKFPLCILQGGQGFRLAILPHRQLPTTFCMSVCFVYVCVHLCVSVFVYIFVCVYIRV